MSSNPRWREQLREATKVNRLPVSSWMLAACALAGLAINEFVNVRPARERLERTEAEESARALGIEPREIAGGKLLMPDGRVVLKK